MISDLHIPKTAGPNRTSLLQILALLCVTQTVSAPHAAAVNLIWTDSTTGQLLRAPIDGAGPANELFGIEDLPGPPSRSIPRGLSSDTRYVYWTDSGGWTYRGPLDGGHSAGLLFDINLPMGLALDEESIFWVDISTARILRGAIDGSGTSVELFGVEDFPEGATLPWSVALEGDFIFWVDRASDQVLRGMSDGIGQVSVLFDSGDYPGLPSSVYSPWDLAISDGFIYWTDEGSDQILRGLIDGSGMVTQLFDANDYPGSPDEIRPRGITIHEGFLYWVDSETDQILRGASDGSGSINVLYDIGDYPGSPSSINPEFITIGLAATQSGDFTGDGNVDGKDFLAWQQNPSIGNLAEWEANYGAAGSLGGTSVVPEPTAWMMGFIASSLLAGVRRAGLTKYSSQINSF